MKRSRFYTTLLLLLLPVVLYAQQDGPPPDDAFNLFLLLLASIAACAFAGAAIVGAFIAMLLFILVAVLIVSGMVSVSFLVGWYKKSVLRGLRTFVYLCTMLLGACLGVSFAFLSDIICSWKAGAGQLWLAGGMGGIAGGFILGRIVLKTLHIACQVLMHRMNRRA